jgi:Na+-translocating ferredoxin:NAD+ oxidoreductase RnfC subunit
MTLDLDPDTIVDELREAGITGAGGAGFPANGKWGPDRLLENHQESEPGYYIDKWLGKEHAAEFAELFQAFIDEGVFDLIVVGAKDKDKDRVRDTDNSVPSGLTRTRDRNRNRFPPQGASRKRSKNPHRFPW